MGRQPRRVLLVEDDAGIRTMVTRHLRGAHYDVLEAGSAEQVLEKLRDRRLRYDVALTDVHLPGLSGLDLSRLLLAASPLKPLILITGDDDEGIARSALDQGVTGYLLKPFELFELDAALAQAISMLDLVEATEALARSQSNHLDEWGEAGGMLPRSWLHLGDERSGAGSGHGGRVMSVAGLLARMPDARLDAHDREVLRTAARTHEIGRLLGPGGPQEVAQRTAQILSNLGFHDGVAELVRDAVAPWSPGLPVGARILAVADRLDHYAAPRLETGADAAEAVTGALSAMTELAGEALDPELVELLRSSRATVMAAWMLAREVTPGAPPASALRTRAGPGAGSWPSP